MLNPLCPVIQKEVRNERNRATPTEQWVQGWGSNKKYCKLLRKRWRWRHPYICSQTRTPPLKGNFVPGTIQMQLCQKEKKKKGRKETVWFLSNICTRRLGCSSVRRALAQDTQSPGFGPRPQHHIKPRMVVHAYTSRSRRVRSSRPSAFT